ncbi:MAG: hypothetical protein JO207_02670 [Verrucomicrobia bacterium]|nr:hypothetical protein [Verrucomicrobiota bacterium]
MKEDYLGRGFQKIHDNFLVEENVAVQVRRARESDTGLAGEPGLGRGAQLLSGD